jgi:hypothetical protein
MMGYDAGGAKNYLRANGFDQGIDPITIVSAEVLQ